MKEELTRWRPTSPVRPSHSPFYRRKADPADTLPQSDSDNEANDFFQNKEGYLERLKGHIYHRWVTEWVVIQHNFLITFTSNSRMQVKKCVPLASIEAIYPSDIYSKDRFQFLVKFSPGNDKKKDTSLCFRSRTQEELNEWVHIIKKNIDIIRSDPNFNGLSLFVPLVDAHRTYAKVRTQFWMTKLQFFMKFLNAFYMKNNRTSLQLAFSKLAYNSYSARLATLAESAVHQENRQRHVALYFFLQKLMSFVRLYSRKHQEYALRRLSMGREGTLGKGGLEVMAAISANKNLAVASPSKASAANVASTRIDSHNSQSCFSANSANSANVIFNPANFANNIIKAQFAEMMAENILRTTRKNIQQNIFIMHSILRTVLARHASKTLVVWKKYIKNSKKWHQKVTQQETTIIKIFRHQNLSFAFHQISQHQKFAARKYDALHKICFQNRQKIAWDYLVSSPCSPPPPRVYPRAPIAKSQQVLYYQAFTRLHYFLQKRDASQLCGSFNAWRREIFDGDVLRIANASLVENENLMRHVKRRFVASAVSQLSLWVKNQQKKWEHQFFMELRRHKTEYDQKMMHRRIGIELMVKFLMKKINISFALEKLYVPSFTSSQKVASKIIIRSLSRSIKSRWLRFVANCQEIKVHQNTIPSPLPCIRSPQLGERSHDRSRSPPPMRITDTQNLMREQRERERRSPSIAPSLSSNDCSNYTQGETIQDSVSTVLICEQSPPLPTPGKVFSSSNVVAVSANTRLVPHQKSSFVTASPVTCCANGRIVHTDTSMETLSDHKFCIANNLRTTSSSCSLISANNRPSVFGGVSPSYRVSSKIKDASLRSTSPVSANSRFCSPEKANSRNNGSGHSHQREYDANSRRDSPLKQLVRQVNMKIASDRKMEEDRVTEVANGRTSEFANARRGSIHSANSRTYLVAKDPSPQGVQGRVCQISRVSSSQDASVRSPVMATIRKISRDGVPAKGGKIDREMPPANDRLTFQSVGTSRSLSPISLVQEFDPPSPLNCERPSNYCVGQILPVDKRERDSVPSNSTANTANTYQIYPSPGKTASESGIKILSKFTGEKRESSPKEPSKIIIDIRTGDGSRVNYYDFATDHGKRQVFDIEETANNKFQVTLSPKRAPQFFDDSSSSASPRIKFDDDISVSSCSQSLSPSSPSYNPSFSSISSLSRNRDVAPIHFIYSSSSTSSASLSPSGTLSPRLSETGDSSPRTFASSHSSDSYVHQKLAAIVREWNKTYSPRQA